VYTACWPAHVPVSSLTLRSQPSCAMCHAVYFYLIFSAHSVTAWPCDVGASRRVVWLGAEEGYAIDYPSIGMHAVGTDSDSFSTPCLFCQVSGVCVHVRACRCPSRCLPTQRRWWCHRSPPTVTTTTATKARATATEMRMAATMALRMVALQLWTTTPCRRSQRCVSSPRTLPHVRA
jgi:hypothetical protein